MNSDSLNKWLALTANLAVFIGLILLVYEVNQANKQLEFTALADSVDNYTQAMETLSQNEDLSKLIYHAETDFESLNEFERWRVFKYLDGFTMMSEQDYLVIMQMDIPLAAFEVDWKSNMSKSMYQTYWNVNEERFTREFRQFVNEITMQDGQ